MPEVHEFAPLRLTYKTDAGDTLVLVVDWHKGFKSYWIERPDGSFAVKPRFYNAEAIRLIAGLK